jgi:hypothetical protein
LLCRGDVEDGHIVRYRDSYDLAGLLDPLRLPIAHRGADGLES